MSRPKAMMHQVPVTATKDGGETRFNAGSDLWDEPSGALHFHKDRHGMSKEDYHLVEFVLDDRTGERLHFPSTPHDAMWVIRAEHGEDTCPDKNSVSDYEVIEPICVCDEGNRLIVRNHNPKVERWAFSLNFVKAGADESDADQYVRWDPIIQNQNGGTGGSGWRP